MSIYTDVAVTILVICLIVWGISLPTIAKKRTIRKLYEACKY